jgi:LysM repeat protein
MKKHVNQYPRPSQPADLQAAIAHFEEGYVERERNFNRNRPKWLAKAVGILALGAAVTVGGIEVGNAVYDSNYKPHEIEATYTVQPNDTEFTIAEDISGNSEDLNKVMYEINQVNPGVDLSHLQPGQIINIPE